MINRTFSEISIRVAGAVITAIVIGLAGISYAFISDKVDQETFNRHCIENSVEFERVRKDIQKQEQGQEARMAKQDQLNEQLLKVLLEIQLDIRELKTEIKRSR